MKIRYLSMIMLFLLACEEDTPGFSELPEIELLSITPAVVQAQQDSIVFEIQYKDGNGDLGSNDDSKRNVFVTDLRIDLEHAFRIQQLAPSGSEIAIQGSFKIFLENTLITGADPEEKVSFEVYVVDRAGNESNVITTPEILVRE